MSASPITARAARLGERRAGRIENEIAGLARRSQIGSPEIPSDAGDRRGEVRKASAGRAHRRSG